MIVRSLASPRSLAPAAPALGAGRDTDARERRLEPRHVPDMPSVARARTHRSRADSPVHSRAACGGSRRRRSSATSSTSSAPPCSRRRPLELWTARLADPVGGLIAAIAFVLGIARAWRRQTLAPDGDEISPELLQRLELELVAFDE
jgi:hypothetical protein